MLLLAFCLFRIAALHKILGLSLNGRRYSSGMAAPLWNSYAVRPAGFPGVASFLAWVLPGSTAPADTILEVRAMVAAAAVATVTDPTAASVTVPLGVNASASAMKLLAGPAVVSWFARVAAGWVKGPEVAVDLSSSWSSNFPYVKPWAVEILQKLAAEGAPIVQGKKVEVRSSFPRDQHPLPSMSVQFRAAPAGARLLGDASKQMSNTRAEEAIAFTSTLSMVLWSEFPEQRDALAPWFMTSMQALSAMAPFAGLVEPSFSLTESEDFSAALMEKPLFLLTCELTGTVWSRVVLPQHNYQGHLTV